MDWAGSYTCDWRVMRVDEATWSDGEVIGGIESASITRTADGSLLESSSLTITADGFAPGYYRLVLTARDNMGDFERVDVCTMLYESTGGTANYSADQLTVMGRSVLQPAQAKAMHYGAYCPGGADGAAYVGSILESVLAAPVSVETSFTMNEPCVHEFGCSVLDAAWEVLNAGNSTIQIDGHGEVHVIATPTDPSLTLDSASARLIVPGIKHDMDMSSVPNRYIAYGTHEVAIAENADPDSPTGLQRRGYAFETLDTSPKPINGETMERYAQRRLEELSQVYDSRTYTREWVPDIYPGSVVRGSLASVSLDGDMRVTNQSIACGNGITVNEQASKEVNLWLS